MSLCCTQVTCHTSTLLSFYVLVSHMLCRQKFLSKLWQFLRNFVVVIGIGCTFNIASCLVVSRAYNVDCDELMVDVCAVG